MEKGAEKAEPFETSLTHGGKRVVAMGNGVFGVPDAEARFTGEDVVEASLAHGALLLATLEGEGEQVTSEITELLSKPMADEQ